MNKIFLYISLTFSCFSLRAQIAVKGDKVYTMAGEVLTNGVVLLKDGKIEKVGVSLKIPSGYTVYEARVVTPGLVDARSVVGLSGPLNIPIDQDQLEKSSPIQPDLRAVDAYNPDDTLVGYLRINGVTTIHTGHGIGALVSGQTMVAKTKPGLIDAVTLVPTEMLAMSLGTSVQANFTSPGTKSKEIALLRTELLKAQGYEKKMGSKDSTKQPARDLNLEMLVKLLHGEVKALIYANTATNIMSAIRLAKEFNLKLVIEGGAEAYRVIDKIKSANAEIIVHPTMARPYGEMANMTMENAAILTKAGVSVSIESGYEGYVPKTRVVLFEAATAAANELPYEEALKAITLNPARLLGLDKRIGSLEKGKDGDVVLYDGDPFEYTTHVCKVIIDGKLVADNCR
ncbi:MAG: amidohydrolase family protein [Chitinophagaceae bacterium]|nr:amidohydrolase family protein [Chitinophagaceae bacterium]